MFGSSAIAKKLAELQAKKNSLAGGATQAMIRQFELGLSLSLCSNGHGLSGTTFSKLGEAGKKNRENDLNAAVKDADTKTYTDPQNPSLVGTLKPEPAQREGKQECRVVEDHLSDGTKTDDALVKYCHDVPDGEWKLKT